MADVAFWDKERSCQEFQRLFEGQEVFLENVDCMEVIPTSLRVNLSAVTDFEHHGLAGLPGGGGRRRRPAPGMHRARRPERGRLPKLLDRLDALTRVLSLSVFGIAVIMLASAIGLVANTLRMGMFARRKEIGIMRLVGATNWRIRVPFLIEGLVESMLGAAAAIAGLFLVKVFVVDNLRGTAPWLP